ncbi:MAG: glycoside hydrolase family 3 C-terminal domain-containing protein [Rhizobacter sp.]|nr:glycoside hydrolase family 3 C-terminal domain-containing protein [Chlorobiales bacterium]
MLNGCNDASLPREVMAADKPSAAVSDARVRELVSKMTLDEKIGQMTQVDRRYLENAGNSVSDIKTYFIGSLLSGGGSRPKENKPEAWAEMYDGYQKIALETRLKIPIIYGIDAVHGHNNVYGATIFPHNIGMGCSRNPELVKAAAQITALEVAGTGIDWTFAPCIAVPQDERWGRTYEGFGETAELAEMMGKAAVEGYQGDSLNSSTSILACVKHFAGDGGTTGGADQGDTRADTADFRRTHIAGYIPAIKAGAGSVMASYNSWKGNKLHGHKYLLTDVLKGELGFNGVVVSDWKGLDQLPGNYESDIETAINAGVDMVMVPEDYKVFITLMKKLIGEKKISMARIDDAVSRILKVKFDMGLFERPYTEKSLTAKIGSPEHRSVARMCASESLVLLKNDKNALPLSKTAARIHVAGKTADNLGYQCGGWTMEWQGGDGNITVGTTILTAIKQSVAPNTKVTYSKDGTGAKGATIGVVVIGEKPYAEFEGDRRDLALSEEDRLAVENMKKAGIPVVTLVVSGRPVILGDVLTKSDALVAAWLPGSEGRGVTDVLFGDKNFKGKLSHSWPKDMLQIPVNKGDSPYAPLFPYGYGLSYTKPSGTK